MDIVGIQLLFQMPCTAYFTCSFIVLVSKAELLIQIFIKNPMKTSIYIYI